MGSVLIGVQGRVLLQAAAPSTNHHNHHHILNRRSGRRCYLPTPLATTRPNTSSLSSSSSSSLFNPLHLRFSSFGGGDLTTREKKKNKDHKGNSPTGRGQSSVCYAGPYLSYPANLNWISAIAALALMLTKGTAINKSFLVPLFALLAPPSVISWIKGEYGIWTAFLALLVRLFFFIPGELELPLMALLLVIVSPYQVMDLRGFQSGAIIALALSGYLAFQHFSRIGNFKQSFEQGSLVATLAIVCLTIVSIMLLI